MFAEQIRQAVQVCQRGRLPELSVAVWKAWGQGLLDDQQASDVAAEIEARKAPAAPAGHARRHVGSRPVSSASIARRRRTVAGGWLPPQISSQFTLSEASVLSIVAGEVAKHGRCELSVGEMAARAGCCATVVKNAVREARRLGLIAVETRKVRFDRNLPNIVTIISADWTAWMRLRDRKTDAARTSGSGGGVRFAPTTRQIDSFPPESPRKTAWTAREFDDGWRRWRRGRLGGRSVE